MRLRHYNFLHVVGLHVAYSARLRHCAHCAYYAKASMPGGGLAPRHHNAAHTEKLGEKNY